MKELLLLSGLGIFALVAELISFRKLIFPIVIIGLFANVFLCVNDFGNKENIYNMLFLDKSAYMFTALFSVVAIFWFILARNHFKETTHETDFFALTLFALVGIFILTSYSHFVMLFLGIEILSIPVYVMAGSEKKNIHSNESAYKYFLLGSFASAFLLLGIVFIYGATNTFTIFNLSSISYMKMGMSIQLLYAGMLLILFALAFKVAAVPFHFWSPDVYTGSPTFVTSFMATLVKIGAVAAFLRMITIFVSLQFISFNKILLIIALVSVVVGNVMAAAQTNIKRMLAYSGIGHVGFILLAICMLSPSTVYVVWYYLMAYVFANIGAFWVLSKLDNNNDLSAFNGLIRRNPILAGTATICMLSMAGIPPLAGFFAKYFVLINLIGNNSILVAVVAILASLIGVYYYFKVIIAIFVGKETHTTKIELPLLDSFSLIVISLVLVIAGVFPDAFFKLFFK